MLAPMSQKMNLLFALKLFIHSSVSGSFKKKVSTLHSVNLLGIKKEISFSNILIFLYESLCRKSLNQLSILFFRVNLINLSKKI